MLHLGQQITSTSDVLQPITLDELFLHLTNPDALFKQRIEQLRIVRTMDAKRYAALKRELPYFVCATFNPAIRKTDNFAHISHFVIDIDHITDKGLDLPQLRNLLYADSRVVMGFLSPSQDGIKLIFQFKERCYDAGQFSLFYKDFVKHFSEQYHLEQVLDTRTSDVTRACFLSHDPHAHYNPFAETIDLRAFIEEKTSTKLFDMKHQQDLEERSICSVETIEDNNAEPNSDTLTKIKEVLGLYRAKKEQPQIYVPEQLNAIIDDLQSFLTSLDIHVLEIKDISYGKKIRVKMNAKHAECNLFFGKRGFSVIKSSKKGTDPELNDILQELILAFLTQIGY